MGLKLETCQWYSSPGTPVSSTNKTNCHDITEILLKVVLKHHKPNQTIIHKNSEKLLKILNINNLDLTFCLIVYGENIMTDLYFVQ